MASATPESPEGAPHPCAAQGSCFRIGSHCQRSGSQAGFWQSALRPEPIVALRHATILSHLGITSLDRNPQSAGAFRGPSTSAQGRKRLKRAAPRKARPQMTQMNADKNARGRARHPSACQSSLSAPICVICGHLPCPTSTEASECTTKRTKKPLPAALGDHHSSLARTQPAHVRIDLRTSNNLLIRK